MQGKGAAMFERLVSLVAIGLASALVIALILNGKPFVDVVAASSLILFGLIRLAVFGGRRGRDR
jgi:phosphatidylserine synthase